jgi:hypothetical protein
MLSQILSDLPLRSLSLLSQFTWYESLQVALFDSLHCFDTFSLDTLVDGNGLFA